MNGPNAMFGDNDAFKSDALANDHDPRRTSAWRAAGWRIGLGVVLLIAALVFGRFARDAIPEAERWIADLGIFAPLVFVILLVLFTSVFVPDTLFAVVAGAIFGLTWGSVYVIVGAILTSVFNFWIARRTLRSPVQAMLSQHPKLSAIEHAANREGLRLMVLLRLAPINPVTVSYVLGASRVRFGPFLLASFAMIPGLFVEVYFGYLATHVSKVAGNVTAYSTLRTTVTILGFVVCVIALVYITRLAHTALKEAERSSE